MATKRKYKYKPSPPIGELFKKLAKPQSEKADSHQAKKSRKTQNGNLKVAEELLEGLIIKHYGNVSLVLQEINERLRAEGDKYSYTSLRSRISRSRHLTALVEESQERILDLVDGNIVDGLKKKKQWTTELMVKTKGYKRGYTKEEAPPTKIEIKVIDYKDGTKIISADEAEYRDSGTAQLSTEGVSGTDIESI